MGVQSSNVTLVPGRGFVPNALLAAEAASAGKLSSTWTPSQAAQPGYATTPSRSSSGTTTYVSGWMNAPSTTRSTGMTQDSTVTPSTRGVVGGILSGTAAGGMINAARALGLMGTGNRATDIANMQSGAALKTALAAQQGVAGVRGPLSGTLMEGWINTARSSGLMATGDRATDIANMRSGATLKKIVASQQGGVTTPGVNKVYTTPSGFALTDSSGNPLTFVTAYTYAKVAGDDVSNWHLPEGVTQADLDSFSSGVTIGAKKLFNAVNDLAIKKSEQTGPEGNKAVKVLEEGLGFAGPVTRMSNKEIIAAESKAQITQKVSGSVSNFHDIGSQFSQIDFSKSPTQDQSDATWQKLIDNKLATSSTSTDASGKTTVTMSLVGNMTVSDAIAAGISPKDLYSIGVSQQDLNNAIWNIPMAPYIKTDAKTGKEYVDINQLDKDYAAAGYQNIATSIKLHINQNLPSGAKPIPVELGRSSVFIAPHDPFGVTGGLNLRAAQAAGFTIAPRFQMGELGGLEGIIGRGSEKIISSTQNIPWVGKIVKSLPVMDISEEYTKYGTAGAFGYDIGMKVLAPVAIGAAAPSLFGLVGDVGSAISTKIVSPVSEWFGRTGFGQFVGRQVAASDIVISPSTVGRALWGVGTGLVKGTGEVLGTITKPLAPLYEKIIGEPAAGLEASIASKTPNIFAGGVKLGWWGPATEAGTAGAETAATKVTGKLFPRTREALSGVKQLTVGGVKDIGALAKSAVAPLIGGTTGISKTATVAEAGRIFDVGTNIGKANVQIGDMVNTPVGQRMVVGVDEGAAGRSVTLYDPETGDTAVSIPSYGTRPPSITVAEKATTTPSVTLAKSEEGFFKTPTYSLTSKAPGVISSELAPGDQEIIANKMADILDKAGYEGGAPPIMNDAAYQNALSKYRNELTQQLGSMDMSDPEYVPTSGKLNTIENTLKTVHNRNIALWEKVPLEMEGEKAPMVVSMGAGSEGAQTGVGGQYGGGMGSAIEQQQKVMLALNKQNAFFAKYTTLPKGATSVFDVTPETLEDVSGIEGYADLYKGMHEATKPVIQTVGKFIPHIATEPTPAQQAYAGILGGKTAVQYRFPFFEEQVPGVPLVSSTAGISPIPEGVSESIVPGDIGVSTPYKGIGAVERSEGTLSTKGITALARAESKGEEFTAAQRQAINDYREGTRNPVSGEIASPFKLSYQQEVRLTKLYGGGGGGASRAEVIGGGPTGPTEPTIPSGPSDAEIERLKTLSRQTTEEWEKKTGIKSTRGTTGAEPTPGVSGAKGFAPSEEIKVTPEVEAEVTSGEGEVQRESAPEITPKKTTVGTIEPSTAQPRYITEAEEAADTGAQQAGVGQAGRVKYQLETRTTPIITEAPAEIEPSIAPQEELAGTPVLQGILSPSEQLVGILGSPILSPISSLSTQTGLLSVLAPKIADVTGMKTIFGTTPVITGQTKLTTTTIPSTTTEPIAETEPETSTETGTETATKTATSTITIPSVVTIPTETITETTPPGGGIVIPPILLPGAAIPADKEGGTGPSESWLDRMFRPHKGLSIVMPTVTYDTKALRSIFGEEVDTTKYKGMKEVTGTTRGYKTISQVAGKKKIPGVSATRK